jgi:hypothetical protein
MTRIRLFSPVQVSICSFVGGPMAAVFTLWKNFDRMGQARRARDTLMYGGVAIFLFLCVVPYLPDWFPPIIIPVVYTAVAGLVATCSQRGQEALKEFGAYQSEGGWRVAGLSIAFLLAFIAFYMMWIMALGAVGLLTITD